jgi:hypothetical protein
MNYARRSPTTRRLAHALVVIVWIVGWTITWKAARATLFFEPTQEALKAAQDAVAPGVLGSCLLLVAALGRLLYRPWRRAALFAVLPAWVLITFLVGPREYGAWLWTLVLVPASVALLAWGVASDARARKRRGLGPISQP